MICFAGDGGFWYHLTEMETARRFGINTVTVVNQNNCLGQCVTPLTKLNGERNGHPEDLYQFTEVRFADIAREMGIEGFRVENPDEICPTLEAALACGAPALVEVVTDPAAEPELPWHP